MQIYAMKFNYFLRFGDKNNSIVFDISDNDKKSLESGKVTMDYLYEEFKKDPIKHINEAKSRGLSRFIGILGCTDGDFDRSNGSGKSSILEGICYCNYDKIVRKLANTDKDGKAGTSVVTRINGNYVSGMKESWVEEFFEEGGKIYRVKRGRSFNKNLTKSTPILEFECLSNDITSEMGHRSGDTNANLESVLSCDYDVFVNSQMFGQSDAGKFLSGTDKVKKEMIISMLKLEGVVDGCINEVRKRKNEQDKKVQNARGAVLNYERDIINSYGKWADNIVECNDEFFLACKKNMNNCILSKENLIKDINVEINGFNEKISSLQNSSDVSLLKMIKEEGERVKNEKINKENQLSQQLKQWDEFIVSCNNNINSKNVQKNDLITKISSIEKDMVTIKKEIDSFDVNYFDQFLLKVQKAKVFITECDALLVDINLKRDQEIKKLSEVELEIKNLNSDILEMETQVSSSEFITCKACKNIVPVKHILSEISKCKDIISSKNEQKNIINESLKEIVANIADIKKRVGNANAYVENESTMLLKQKTFENNKEKYSSYSSNLQDKKEQLSVIEKEISSLLESKNNYVEKKNSISLTFESDLKDLSDKLKELSDKFRVAKESSSKILNEIELYKNNVQLKSSSRSSLEKEIGAITKEIESVSAQIKNLENSKVVLSKETLCYQRYIVLEDVFGLDGVQSRVIKRYLPLLNLYIKEYIDILSGGTMSLSLEFNNRSEVVLNISGGTSDTYEMLSGGEKTLVRLSVDIGLALLEFSRLAKKPELICLDEIFAPLDNFYKETVFKVLNKLSDVFSRVIIISHKTEIQNLIESNIVVEKSSGMNGLSTIKTLINR